MMKKTRLLLAAAAISALLAACANTGLAGPAPSASATPAEAAAVSAPAAVNRTEGQPADTPLGKSQYAFLDEAKGTMDYDLANVKGPEAWLSYYSDFFHNELEPQAANIRALQLLDLDKDDSFELLVFTRTFESACLCTVYDIDESGVVRVTSETAGCYTESEGLAKIPETTGEIKTSAQATGPFADTPLMLNPGGYQSETIGPTPGLFTNRETGETAYFARSDGSAGRYEAWGSLIVFNISGSLTEPNAVMTYEIAPDYDVLERYGLSDGADHESEFMHYYIDGDEVPKALYEEIQGYYDSLWTPLPYQVRVLDGTEKPIDSYAFDSFLVENSVIHGRDTTADAPEASLMLFLDNYADFAGPDLPEISPAFGRYYNSYTSSEKFFYSISCVDPDYKLVVTVKWFEDDGKLRHYVNGYEILHNGQPYNPR